MPGGVSGGVQRDEDSRRLQKLSELDLQLESFKDFGDSVKGLAGLKGLEGLKGLDGLKGLEGLKSMEGLKGLADLAHLKGLDAFQDFRFQTELFDVRKQLFEIDRGFARQRAHVPEGQGQGRRPPGRDGTARARPRNRAYDQAREFLDQGKYDRAVERFTDVIAMKGARADAALYWKA